MINAMEVITVEATAPGASASFSAVTGDSLTVRATSKRGLLLGLWSRFQTSGHVALSSPRLHDNQNGLQHSAVAGVAETELPIVQELFPQDIISVSGSGSGTAGDIEQASMLIGYEDLSGVKGGFMSPAEVVKNAKELHTVRLTVSGGTSGGYSGSEAINNDQDSFKRNERYAVLGVSGDTEVATIGITSPDWGNLRVGVPGSATPGDYSNWFMDLGQRALAGGAAVKNTVPVFNASNVGRTLVDIATNEDGGSPEIVIWLARL